MNPFQYLKALDHHAYFIHSFKDSVSKFKEYIKEKFNIHSTQNPDLFHEKFETLGIDDSRRIKDIHLSKSFTEGSKRIFIIEAANITHEAQNSLLKIFEEPNEGSHFFLIMPTIHTLLPTLRSRLYIMEMEGVESHGLDIFNRAKQFLKLSKKDKINFVDELAKDISDEVLNRSDAQEFLAALEIVIYNEQGITRSEGLKSILKARDYLNDRSPSIKQLLEYVALSV